MPPVNQKSSLKIHNIEKKAEKKKWKEQKLLKAAGFQKGLEDVVNSQNEKEPILSLPRTDDVSEQTTINNNLASCTVSIAVPGSILDNAQSPELRTYLVGQIARAACIYSVDEIIVFDDKGSQSNSGLHVPGESSCAQMAGILQYLECPQYLRKHLFPIHKNLQYAGVLNPLDAPHHLRQSDDFPFREGIVTNHLLKQGKGSYVNVGLIGRYVCVDRALAPGLRVTVHLQPEKEGSRKRFGEIVSPSVPRQMLGVYWGYTVRLASSLSNVFANAPYDEGYDLTLGTSDKGTPLDSCADSDFQGFKHILIVFGGLEGLEAALECDENLELNDVSLLFDKYLNTCASQGTRTIRTEEAILISLAQLVPKFSSRENADIV